MKQIYYFGCCITIAAKGGSSPYTPSPITVFRPGHKPPGLYTIIFDNRYTTGGAAATEFIYLYFVPDDRPYNYTDAGIMVVPVRPGDVLVLEKFPAELLYRILAQSDQATTLYRNLYIYPEVIG